MLIVALALGVAVAMGVPVMLVKVCILARFSLLVAVDTVLPRKARPISIARKTNEAVILRFPDFAKERMTSHRPNDCDYL